MQVQLKDAACAGVTRRLERAREIMIAAAVVLSLTACNEPKRPERARLAGAAA